MAKPARTNVGSKAKTSAKVTKPKKAAAPEPEDPRFAAVIRALATKPKLAGVVRDYHASRSGPRKFGSDALKLNGKLFAMFRHGTLVVKLSKERTDALVAAKVGKYFEPGTGRVMKQWLTVTSPKADWLAIVLEAHDYQASGG